MSDDKDNLSFDFNGNSNNNNKDDVENKPTVNVNSKGKTNGKGLLNKKLEKTIIYSVIGIVILGGVYEGVGAYQAQHDKTAILHKQKAPSKDTNAPLPSALDQTTQSVSVQPSQVTTFSTDDNNKPNNKELKMLQAEIAKLKNKKNLESAKMGQIYASGIIAMSGNVSSSNPSTNNNSNSSISQQINKTKQEIAQAEKEEKNNNSSTSNGTGNNDSSMLKYINDAVGANGKQSSNTNSPQSSDENFTKQQSTNNLDGTIKIHNKIPNEALTIGTVIPATLVTRIDTQVPGTVKAQVNRNIYNRNGIKVIPRGSVLIGSYDSQTFNGQNRVLMAFNRMIMPNGDYLRLKGMGSNGPRGAAGSIANVDNHFWTVFGSSLLVALVAQGVQQIGNSAGGSGGTQNYYGNSSNSSGTYSAGAQVLEQSLGDILQPYTNIPSTLTIPQGKRITIITNKTVLFGNE